MAEQHSLFIHIGDDIYNSEIQIKHFHNNYNNEMIVTQLLSVTKNSNLVRKVNESLETICTQLNLEFLRQLEI